MGKRTYNNIKTQEGFSLWELSIVMLIMIGLFVALVNIMPMILKRDHVEFDHSIVVKVDEQLLGFIATFSRLPCPDSNNDGIEDCGSSSGTIPYKTIGLNEDYAGVGSIPLVYAVFTNTVASANLTELNNLFNPTDSHGTVTEFTMPENKNGLDFCSALTNAKASTFSSSFAHIVLPNGTLTAVPYVIVTAGLGNADGTGTNFDGRNDNTTMDFEPPNKVHNTDYDDTVFSKNFDELAITLNCDTAQNSLNLLADAKATHTENVTQQASIKDGAELAIVITVMQTALGVANTAMAVYNLVLAVIEVVAAGVNLVAAIAACIASLGTACGLVAKAIAALVLGVLGVVAAGVSVAANIAALVLQVVAVVKIIDVANRAGSVVAVPDPNTAEDANGNVTNNGDLAVQVRDEANKLQKEAADKVIETRGSINDANGLATSVRSRFVILEGRTTSLRAAITAANEPNLTNTSTDAWAEHILNNYAVPTVTNLADASTEANLAVAALGAPLSTPGATIFDPPVITYPNVNFVTVKTHLGNAEPKMTAAGNAYTYIDGNYGNIRAWAIIARDRATTLINAHELTKPVYPTAPPAVTAARINAYVAALNTWQTKKNQLTLVRDRTYPVTDYVDELFVSIFHPDFNKNIFNTWIKRELSLILAAQGNTTGAYENITAAIDADANATYMENNIGAGNPGATTSVLNLSLGVDEILQKADEKGVEK